MTPHVGYPEHKKVSEVKDRSQAVGEFLEWLSQKGIFLCEVIRRSEYDDPKWFPVSDSQRTLLEDFFNIDGKAFDEEKCQILEQIRNPFGQNAKERQTLEQMREWRATGSTFAAIAADLNTCGYKTRDKTPWSELSVARILEAL